MKELKFQSLEKCRHNIEAKITGQSSKCNNALICSIYGNGQKCTLILYYNTSNNRQQGNSLYLFVPPFYRNKQEEATNSVFFPRGATDPARLSDIPHFDSIYYCLPISGNLAVLISDQAPSSLPVLAFSSASI